MIKNYYYLTVGVLAIFFSFTHAWNGHSNVLPLLNETNLDQSMKTTIFYVWHIIGAENFIFGIAFIAMAFYKEFLKVKFAAWLIAGIMIIRLLVIFGSTLFQNRTGLKDLLIDIIATIIFVGLIILGTRIKEKAIINTQS
jgi:hypothetical protein